MGGFAGEFEELEVDVAVGLFDFVEEDIGGVVAVFSGSDFKLFDIAEAVVFCGLADGEDGVEEVVEFFAAGEVVLCDGAGEGAFGGVGYDEQGPAVAFLEVHQFHHKESGIDAFVAAVAEVGEVVDDDDGAVFLQGGGFDVLDDFFFVVFDIEGDGVDFRAVEIVGKDVASACFLVGVAHLELFVGEFAVYEEYGAVHCDFVCHLDGVDGFAEVGVGEEAADFAFVPEFVIEFAGVGAEGCVGYGLVGCLDSEHSDAFDAGEVFDFFGDGVYWIICHCFVCLGSGGAYLRFSLWLLM